MESDVALVASGERKLSTEEDLLVEQLARLRDKLAPVFRSVLTEEKAPPLVKELEQTGETAIAHPFGYYKFIVKQKPDFARYWREEQAVDRAWYELEHPYSR